ncbi:hypothetical protein K3495_g10640 [Podosphaera aphanis]|nr:hypothetical protein K3495_g10640 [Podosphaera aphanis]
MSQEEILLVRSPVPRSTDHNPFPQLLQTPSGLAILEVQGTLNLPQQNDEATSEDPQAGVRTQGISIGRLVFPEYDESDASSTAWMKRVYLYVGKHQRLTGEVKKLPKALAIIRKKKHNDDMENVSTIQLEITEIVKYKILFSNRPEPIGN